MKKKLGREVYQSHWTYHLQFVFIQNGRIVRMSRRRGRSGVTIARPWDPTSSMQQKMEKTWSATTMGGRWFHTPGFR